jgi:hypothetical protein
MSWLETPLIHPFLMLIFLAFLYFSVYDLGRVEIRGSPIVQDYNVHGEDNHGLRDGGPSNSLYLHLLLVICEAGPVS